MRILVNLFLMKKMDTILSLEPTTNKKDFMQNFLPKSLCMFEQKDCVDKDLPIILDKALLTHLQETDCCFKENNKSIKFILKYSFIVIHI